MNTLGTFNLAILIPLGLSLLIAVRLVFGPRSATGDDVLRRVLSISGQLMIALGFIGVLLGLGPWIAILNVVVLIVVSVGAILRFRQEERRGLLWSLAIAAQKDIPLHHAAWSFAAERSDGLSGRTMRLASLLENGLPLPAALDASRIRVPADALLAIRMGQEWECLGTTLGETVQQDDDLRETANSIVESIWYLMFVGITGFGISLFLFLVISPVTRQMETAFNSPPVPLMWPIEAIQNASFSFREWYYADLRPRIGTTYLIPLVILLGAGLILVLTSPLILGLICWLGLLPRELPAIRALWLPFDRSLILRALSWGVGRGRPLPEIVSGLRRQFPRGNIRRRLHRAEKSISEGSKWTTALHKARLLTDTDAAVLQSAQRAGNLQWALQELSQRNYRRLVHWLKWYRSLMIPALVAGAGFLIYHIFTVVLLPLVSVIQHLSR